MIKVECMQYFFGVIACLIFSVAVHANDPPRGIYRASEVPGSPLLLASGLAWSNAGLVIADRKEKRLVVLRPDGERTSVSSTLSA